LEPVKIGYGLYLEPVKIGCGLYLEPVKIGCGLYLEPVKISITAAPFFKRSVPSAAGKGSS